MSSLVCLVSPDRPSVVQGILRSIVQCMEHEEWYVSGTHSCVETGVHVGWTGAIGLGCCTSMANERGDVTLVLVGDIIADERVAARLRSGGHSFGPGAEYAVHLYEEEGPTFVLKLNGYFAGVLIDRRTRECLVFNDRYGLKRLFYARRGETLVVATEAKAQLMAFPETRAFHPEGLGQFVLCGCTLGGQSLFSGVEVAPAATLWRVAADHSVSRGTYFDPGQWEAQDVAGEAAFLDEFSHTLGAAVRRCVTSEAAVGISLTGGLDSRVVMAELCTQHSPFRCYTFGSMLRQTYDVRVAAEVADACGQSHQVLALDRNFLEGFASGLDGAVYRSDGYLGPSGAAELYLNRMARAVGPVRLTGNYGSELLRGVRAFKCQVPRAFAAVPLVVPYLRGASSVFAEAGPANSISFAAFFQAGHQGHGRFSIEDSLVTLRTPFMDNDIVSLIYRRPLSLDAIGLYEALIARHKPELMTIATDRGDLGHGSPWGRQLRRLHREVLFRAEYRVGHRMPQWVDDALGWLGPASPSGLFSGRHKFEHFHMWWRRELSGYLRDVALPAARVSAYTDYGVVRRMVQDHLAGRRNWADEIDTVVTILVGERVLLGGPSL